MPRPRFEGPRRTGFAAAALASCLTLLALPSSSATTTKTTTTAAQPSSLISFDVTDFNGFNAREGQDTHIDIPVKREGDTSAAATVDYETVDHTANQRTDYTIALGTLTFAPGETRKTFRVLIGDDHRFAGGTAVSALLQLSNPTGAGLGATHTTQLNIFDDEFDTPRTDNLIDQPAFFVRQHYADFLNRVPDAAGQAFWTSQATGCGAADPLVCRINVSAAFFLSIEFQETGFLAYLTRRAATGARPPYRQFMRDTQALQRGFAFGLPGAEGVLEANKQAFFASFVRGPEFVAAFPQTLTPAEFVDALYANAGVTPAPTERQAAVGEFGGAATTADLSARARALRRVAENREFARREFNAAFVLMEYFGYLRRDPGGGIDFWLSKLNRFDGNFIDAEMVKAFIISLEYRDRFEHN